MSLRVYVAGSSAEIDRVLRWSDALRSNGITVTSSWPENIIAVGSANPRDASKMQRYEWALQCLSEVSRSSVLWFLVPSVDRPTRGAWAELGVSWNLARTCIASGDTKQSVFCALAEEYETDEEAFAKILRLAR